MQKLVDKIAMCVERGKINKQSSYPPDMKGQDGADEIVKNALDAGTNPDVILNGCILGMDRIGEKFSQNKVYVPDLLMAAKAMNAAMVHLQPFFKSGKVQRRGTFVIGTVTGALHDVGKNLVAMIVEGGGWEVVNLGVDVSVEKFLEALKNHPKCVMGLSALLTTTMTNMKKVVAAIKEHSPTTKVIVGGAPLTQEYADEIGADPQEAVDFLNKIAA